VTSFEGRLSEYRASRFDLLLAIAVCVRDARAETRLHFSTVIRSVVRRLVVSERGSLEGRIPTAAATRSSVLVLMISAFWGVAGYRPKQRECS
jgi:hypothetical protein